MRLQLRYLAAALAFPAAVALFLHHALSVLPWHQWPPIPFDATNMTTDQIILAYGVLPRAVVAFTAGASLALAGALLQLLLRNPIAEPSTLGVSAGAQLAIVAATLFYPNYLDGNRTLVAFMGAAFAITIVFALGWRRNFDPVTMIVSGLLVGVTCSAVSAALTLSQGEYLMSLVTWNGGSLAQQDWSPAEMLTGVIIFGLFLSLSVVRPLALLSLGDASAASLGVALTGVRLVAVFVAVSLVATVAGHVGLISFVGLGGPALARALGARRPGWVLTVSPVLGGLLLWLCDGLVELASSMDEPFPTGALTALVGGPLLLWLLPKVRPVEPVEARTVIHARRGGRIELAVLVTIISICLYVGFALAKTSTGWTVLSGRDVSDLFPLRWPRLVAASSAGALLAIAGTILQRLTGNAMASPEVIGVSGGAGIGFALALTIVPKAGPIQLFIASGAGAISVMAVVLAFVSRRDIPPERLLLAGIAVSSFTSAVLSALLAIGDQRSWQILSWLGGSAATATPATAAFLFLAAVGGVAFSILFSRWLAIFALGQSVPVALGVSVRRARISMICVAGLATGAASLLVGPLSFVGLLAPHMALRLGFNRAVTNLVMSAIVGALLMIAADIGARSLTFPYELPLGLFAALIGAPYLVWLMGKGRS